MKVLFMIPRRYGLFYSLKKAFETQEAEVYPVDFYEFISSAEKKFNVQVFRLPDKLRQRWETYYLQKINKKYLEIYNKVQPDMIFIYNNEMLLPETLVHFKKRSKVAFFLGDHPLYTPLNRYFLALLFQADAIFAPDNFWINQLKKMGLKNLHHFCPGIPEEFYFEKNNGGNGQEQNPNDILYIGMCYANNWGYKKARFLNQFTDFNLHIHGNKHWKRWFPFFPELEQHFHLKSNYYSQEKMNDLFNATRIIPIDGNPGVIQGVHFRLFEALGAGALPVLEWQDDLKTIFPNMDLPAPKSYEGLSEMAEYYLNNEEQRKVKVAEMKKAVREKYAPQKNGQLILESLGMK